MTDKPTPKEIDDLVYELRQAGTDDTYSIARAVLAKWGQPAQAAEPVAYVEVKQKRSEMSMTWWPEPAGFSLPTGRYRLYTTPQPTQTQPVAREPLTDGQIQDLLLCGNPTDEEMRLIRIGWDAAHGITGGQS